MDLLQLLEEAGATAPPSRECAEHVRSQLLAAARVPAHAPAKTSPRRRGRTRRWVAPFAACAVVLTSAAAIALNHSNPRTTLTIECGTASYIPSESGDPIADCRQALVHQGMHVSTLVGWITPTGLVAVFPKGQEPPPGSTPLPVGFRQDRSVLFVNDMLNDTVSPLATQCNRANEAVAYASRYLDIAGLLDWKVKVRHPSNAESANCLGYFGLTDAPSRTVTLIPQPAPNLTGTNKVIYDANPGVRLDRLLHTQLLDLSGPHCMTLANAAALAERDAHLLAIPTADVTITQAGSIESSGPTCAVPAIDPAGALEVALWAVPPSTSSSP
jgi:hypothetical protein